MAGRPLTALTDPHDAGQEDETGCWFHRRSSRICRVPRLQFWSRPYSRLQLSRCFLRSQSRRNHSRKHRRSWPFCGDGGRGALGKCLTFCTGLWRLVNVRVGGQAMREVIPLMNIMAEISCVFDEVYMPKPQVKCKVFEDNQSCIAIAESSKFTPRTKHIALKYHHFRSFAKNKALEIFPIDTEEQTAGIFTKPLDEKTLLYLRKKLSGW